MQLFPGAAPAQVQLGGQVFFGGRHQVLGALVGFAEVEGVVAGHRRALDEASMSREPIQAVQRVPNWEIRRLCDCISLTRFRATLSRVSVLKMHCMYALTVRYSSSTALNL